MKMSEEEFIDEEKKKFTSKEIEGEISNADDRDTENKFSVSENIGNHSDDVEEKEELHIQRRRGRGKKFICEDSNSDNDESNKEKQKSNGKVDKECADWDGKSYSNVAYHKTAVGDIFDNYKSKSRRSFLASDDEVEDENYVSISKSRAKAKFKNKSFVDSDDENISFIENKETNENENDDSEFASISSNEHENKCNGRKHCFDDDSEAGSDQGEMKGKDISLHSPSKQKDDLEKSQRKALEELVHRKKYGTRKGACDEAIQDNKDLNEELFKNKDLFSAGNSSESEEEPEAEETCCSVSEEGNESMMSRKLKKEKEPKVKKPTKSMIKEQTSEQQRLLRERKIDLPYHQPEVANIKQFLKRVPKLHTPKRVDNYEAVDFQKTSSVQNLLQEKPRLSMDTMEFEDDSSDEVTVVKQDEPKPKEKKKLDSFMQRFAKHTKGHKKETKSDDSHDVVITSQTPGLAHEVLKSQLKQRIQEERRRSCQEFEKQLKLYHAEDMSDDGEVDEEEGEMEDEEVDENDGIGEVEEEDEELSKWNAEDDRKHLEMQLEENLEEEKDLGKSGSSADLISAPLPEKTQRTVNEVHLPEESTQWSDSSSLIAPGQGNCVCTTATSDVKSTPFTKLLKSGLLDSASKSSFEKGNSLDENFSGLELPCENTQDLYKHDDSKPQYKEEESQNVPAGFHFTLDEETQFEEILDSQGNFNDNKRVRKASAKKLFDNHSQHTPESMTQLLGFCSGHFGSGTSETETEKYEEKSEKPANIKDSGFFDLVDCENDIENAMDFCSGKLSDFKTQHEANSQEKDSSPDKIYPSDKDNLENGESDTKKEYLGESKDTGDFFEEPAETQSQVKENEEKGMSVEEDISAVIEEEQDDREDDGISVSDGEDVDDDNFINDADDEMENGDYCDSESDAENDNDEYDDDKKNVPREEPEELQEWKEFVKGETTRKKLNKRAFYEVEAELSGSDVNSADEDLGSEFDEYEIDSEAEEGLPSGDKLRRQVHKIHQRKMIDQDKKEVRLLQELYFEDGDLGVGQARKRNFRWKNIDEVTLNDHVNNKSDGEGDEIITTNVEARMERIEKEKFLQQSQNDNCVNHLDESSQSILNIILNKEKAKENIDLTKKHTRRSKSTGLGKRSGSFLNKNVTSIASKTMLRSSSQKTSKSYVFQAVEDQAALETKNKKNLERAKSHQPARKRQKIERQSSSPNPSSIFNLL